MNYYENFFNTIFLGNTIENYAWFFGILCFALIFKRFISKFLSRLLFRLFKRYSADVASEKFVELLVKPIGLLVIFILIYLAINQLSFPLEERIFPKKTWTYLFVLDKVFLFSISIAITWSILRIIDFIALVFAFKASLTESRMDDQLVPFFKESAKVIVYITASFAILGTIFEVNVTSLIAGLGIGGLALALAAKESLENLIASFTIFLDKPFVVGDLVQVENFVGNIEKVGFRSTRLKTLDKSIITLPNKKMVDGALDNLTLRDFRRVKFQICLVYSTTKEELEIILKEIEAFLKAHPKINQDSLASFESFGEYSLNLMVLYFIEIMEYAQFEKVKEEINFKIMEIVLKNGSAFAYPTRVIYQKQ